METFPPLPKCLNTNLTEMMPTVMDSMTHDKPIVMKNKTWMCPGDSVQSMRSVAVPCYINTTNTIVMLGKSVCQNDTSQAVTDLETKCVDNRNGLANGTADISGELVTTIMVSSRCNFNFHPLQPLRIGSVYQEYDSIQLTVGEEVEITCK